MDLDHPAYKLEITVDGDRGTLHFECHFVNAETKVVEVTAGDADVARIDGKWLITNFVGGTELSRPVPDARAESGRRPSRQAAAPLSADVDDPFVRAVARLPVKVRTKLLIAFVGTSILLVAVGLFGQLVLGQSNDRVVSLRAIQERAIACGQLQREVLDLRQLLAENVAGDFSKVWTEVEDQGIRRRSIYTLGPRFA